MNQVIKGNQQWNYKNYRNIQDDKRYEVLRGHRSMIPAPNEEHQRISRNVEFLIFQFIENKSLGEIYDAPFDVILDQNNVVQPDIIFISRENIKIIKEKGIFGSPDLIIEIISPSTKVRDTYEKKELYEHFKVKEYWIIDPKNKTVEIFCFNKEEKYELFSNGYFDESNVITINNALKSNVLEGLDIRLDKIFKKVSR
jgi:Uma2 family endonuclease